MSAAQETTRPRRPSQETLPAADVVALVKAREICARITQAGDKFWFTQRRAAEEGRTALAQLLMEIERGLGEIRT